MKVKYRIEISPEGWFKYYSTKTGRKYGKWDAFQPPKDENHLHEPSSMPKNFRSEILTQIFSDRNRHFGSRKLDMIAKSIWKAGIVCGWIPSAKAIPHGFLVYWEAVAAKNGKKIPEFGFAVVHGRWRRECGLIKPLLRSKAFLRFVVDNWGRCCVWGVEKGEPSCER